jgi:hypothetical protein
VWTTMASPTVYPVAAGQLGIQLLSNWLASNWHRVNRPLHLRYVVKTRSVYKQQPFPKTVFAGILRLSFSLKAETTMHCQMCDSWLFNDLDRYALSVYVPTDIYRPIWVNKRWFSLPVRQTKILSHTYFRKRNRANSRRLTVFRSNLFRHRDVQTR